MRRVSREMARGLPLIASAPTQSRDSQRTPTSGSTQTLVSEIPFAQGIIKPETNFTVPKWCY